MRTRGPTLAGALAASLAVAGFCGAGLAVLPRAARAEAPMSAIDWLSGSVVMPAGASVRPGLPRDPSVARRGRALPQDVVTSALDGASPNAVGTLNPTRTGLPRDLWGIGRTDEIAARITREGAGAVPALHDLLVTMLLARATPPADSGTAGDLLLARLDKLLDLGALAEAQALIDAVPRMTPQVFRRAFDVALLSGTEDRACATLGKTPDLSPTYPARIFCLARSGDWNGAALTLRMAQALGYVSPAEDRLVTGFLDPDLVEEGADLLPPPRITPLTWRLLDASGEAPPTATLPLAFSHLDLRETGGWKAQCEAAERLARAGAITPQRFRAIFTERKPAASGGLWDRIAAFQAFDAALDKGNAAAVAAALPPAWDAMSEAETEVPFADLYAERLARLTLPPAAAAAAFRVALVSQRFAQAGLARRPADAGERFLIGVARGDVTGPGAPDGLARAVAPAFAPGAALAPDLATLLDQKRVGEAILAALERIADGAQGDPRGVTEGLALLRKVGLDDTARRAALQLLVLERRG